MNSDMKTMRTYNSPRLSTFSVSHGKLRLQIQVLKSVWDVEKAFSIGSKPAKKKLIAHAFFEQFGKRSKHFGRIVLPSDGSLSELIPHEVAHAVISYFETVSGDHEEMAATAIGRLSALIFNRIKPVIFSNTIH